MKFFFLGINIYGNMALMLSNICRKYVKGRIVDQCPLSSLILVGAMNGFEIV
jgi:hypothetical protein